MDFDLSIFIGAAVQGVPLVFVVIGLVWVYGKIWGLQGAQQFASSMLTGLVLGLGYMVSQSAPPLGDWYPQFQYWFAAVFYGLGLGVLASGIYEVAKDAITKAIGKLFADGLP